MISSKQLTIWSVDEANQQLQHNFSAAYWAFLIAQINYPEVIFDRDQQLIRFADYIPLKTLIQEILTRIQQQHIALTQCQCCQNFFDMNQTEGIFSDFHNLTGFICQPCAQQLSAWRFYQEYLKQN
ncbi:MAG: hypothetical protein SVR94_05510 [Pseudomonadota bacterium]|nr:hypothetical protein [Pseudomonadota bacterium]